MKDSDIEQYKGLLYKRASVFYNKGVPREDILSYGMYGLLISLKKKENFIDEAHFKHYMGKRVEGEIIEGMHKFKDIAVNQRRHKNFSGQWVSLEEFDGSYIDEISLDSLVLKSWIEDLPEKMKISLKLNAYSYLSDTEINKAMKDRGLEWKSESLRCMGKEKLKERAKKEGLYEK